MDKKFKWTKKQQRTSQTKILSFESEAGHLGELQGICSPMLRLEHPTLDSAIFNIFLSIRATDNFHYTFSEGVFSDVRRRSRFFDNETSAK